MPDFMDEVRAEVRNERFLALFEQYKYHMLALAVMLVVGTGGASWVKHHRLSTQQEAGAQYLEANEFVEKGDLVSALPRLNIVIDKGTPGWRSLAMLQRAALYVEQKKFNEAKQAYEEIIADSSVDTLFRDYAAIMSAWLMMEHGEGDKAMIEQWLTAMSGADKPWHYTATELLAVFHMKQGDNEKARTLLTSLKDAEIAPSAMQKRAGELLATLPAAPETKPETKKE